MKMLITEKALSVHKGLVPFECFGCIATFYKSKSEARRILKGTRKGLYCSKACQYKNDPKKLNVQIDTYTCNICHCQFQRNIKNVKLGTKNSYCSKKCSIKALSNRIDWTNSTRSKLERFVEIRIREMFPTLKFLTNDRNELGLELDFLFPTLKLAFEFNGIVHYEPIYGQDKFVAIKNKDKQKLLYCATKGIELCVIKDVRTKKERECLWSKLHEILNGALHRN